MPIIFLKTPIIFLILKFNKINNKIIFKIKLNKKNKNDINFKNMKIFLMSNVFLTCKNYKTTKIH